MVFGNAGDQVGFPCQREGSRVATDDRDDLALHPDRRQRLIDRTRVEAAPRNLERADQAIAMAGMFLAEHIKVRAILALTESGGTARFLSRFRSSVPIFGLSRHDGARRKMALMRDVFPIAFDSRGLPTREAARGAIKQLFDRELLGVGDRVVITSGDHMELHGATNTLRLLQVGADGVAEGLGEL